jgi:L-arabinokinase
VLVAYVSGHGFGHSTRVGEVLRTLRDREPALPLAVVSSAPERLFREAVPGDLTFRRVECDVGLAQPHALEIDEAETLRRWRTFHAGDRERTRAEAEWLRQAGARLVLGDIPPLAFAAALGAGIPAVGLANFSWDWVYRHLAGRHPGLAEAAAACAAAYREAALLLELPFAGDLSAFPRREAIPLVARKPSVARAEVRRRLGLGDDRPVVLVSFGGLGFPGLSLESLGNLDRFRFVVSQNVHAPIPNVLSLSGERLGGLGLGYVDLVGAADVVVTKPGYGIVSDAIAARARLVYTDRGDFPEYEVLVREMPRYLPCAHVSRAELMDGRLRPALEAALEAPLPEPPPLDGAASAADRLLERL